MLLTALEGNNKTVINCKGNTTFVCQLITYLLNGLEPIKNVETAPSNNNLFSCTPTAPQKKRPECQRSFRYV